MKCTIPEISWHNKDPVLSIDIQPNTGENFYRLASGGTDSHVLIWHLTEQVSGIPCLECVSDLTRHQKAVNVVRFSPSGNLLASGDDESVIILWKQKTDQDLMEFPEEQEVKNSEQWLVFKILRGHLEDIYDLSWSPDGNNIISGSVDNTAVIWDIKKGRMKEILRDHKSFVQGVAWDPCGQFLATLSSDRICRIFNSSNQKPVSRVGKAILPGAKPDAKPVHLFHDDTLKSFFRRLCFTPCGSFLITPAGIIEPQEPGQKAVNTTLIFPRNSLSKPVAYLPSFNQYSVAVRCCPKLFTLRDMKEPALFNLPYRIVFAIATQTSVILYDSQHFCPFAYITNIHYTRLTDLTWSSDGKILIVSSTDGFCSIITFSDNELGETYMPNKESEFQMSNEEKQMKSGKECSKTSDCSSEVACSEIQSTVLENFSSKIFNLGKTDVNCSRLKDDSVMKLHEENVESKNCRGKLASNFVARHKSVADETIDYDLVLEETINDSVNVDSEEINIASKKSERVKKSNFHYSECEKLLSKEEGEEKEFSDVGSKVTLAETEKNSQVNFIAECTENDCLCPSNINLKTPSKDASALSSPVTSVPPNANCTPPHNITPIEQRKPKRAQLITLSSPKSKKKL